VSRLEKLFTGRARGEPHLKRGRLVDRSGNDLIGDTVAKIIKIIIIFLKIFLEFFRAGACDSTIYICYAMLSVYPIMPCCR
jgi:hypothetical protein